MSEQAPAARRQINLVEGLVVVAIVAVLIALLTSEPQWVSDEKRPLPVQVFVFELSTGKPIIGAEIAVFPHGSAHLPAQALEIADQLPLLESWDDHLLPRQRAFTNASGVAVVEFNFSSVASNRRPQRRCFPGNCWVAVRAATGQSTIQRLGMAPVLIEDVNERGGFFAPIGISTTGSGGLP